MLQPTPPTPDYSNVRRGRSGTRTRQQAHGRAPLNPLWLALCWNSHRLSKQSNSGSMRRSIGGIETELVVSRGQEILTRALCRLQDTHTHTQVILVNTCTQMHEHTHVAVPSSFPAHTCLASSQAQTTSTPVAHEQIRVLSAGVRAVCQQFVSK